MINLEETSVIVEKGESYEVELPSDYTFKEIINPNPAALEVVGTKITPRITCVAFVTIIAKDSRGFEDSATLKIEVPGLVMSPDLKDIEIRTGKNCVVQVVKKLPCSAELTADIVDKKVARVKSVGASSIMIEGIADGTTKVTLKLSSKEEQEDGTTKETVYDTVEYDVTVGTLNSLEVEKKMEVDFEEDKELTLTIKADPTQTEFHYKSSNPEVVAVEEGKIILKGVGSSDITVCKFGVEKTCQVTVTGIQIILKKELTVGRKSSLDVISSLKGVPSFKSSDETIISVDEYGKLEGLKEGKATITVTVKEETAEIEIEVAPYFEAPEKVTEDILKTAKILPSEAAMKIYAAGREVKSAEVEGLQLYFVKLNPSQENTFKAETVILYEDSLRWLMLKQL